MGNEPSDPGLARMLEIREELCAANRNRLASSTNAQKAARTRTANQQALDDEFRSLGTAIHEEALAEMRTLYKLVKDRLDLEDARSRDRAALKQHT